MQALPVGNVDPYDLVAQLEADVRAAKEIPNINARLEEAVSRTEGLPVLQSRVFALFDRVNKAAPERLTDQEVRDTFYNIMAEMVALDAKLLPTLESDQGKVALTTQTLIRSMEQSSRFQGQIQLLNGKLLTLDNCPDTFKSLAAGILAIKEGNDPKRDAKAKVLARKICEREEFRRLIGDVMKFCKESLGQMKVEQLREPSAESLRGVTEALVRKTFYEIMATHAMLTGCVTHESVSSRESFIYISLSYHALIDVIVQSRDIKRGVALLDNKVMTIENSPAKYSKLAPVIFSLKDKVLKLTGDELIALKSVSVEDEASKLSPELAKLKTKELMVLAQAIIDVAIEISRLDTFKEIIEQVITFIDSGKAPDAVQDTPI